MENHLRYPLTPDQLSGVAGYIAREYGAEGYRIVHIGTPIISVAVFHVVARDGSRFAVAADKWGNVMPIPKDMGESIDLIRAMHANAVTP